MKGLLRSRLVTVSNCPLVGKRVFDHRNIEVHIGRKPYLGSIYCLPLLIHRLDLGLGGDGDGIGHVQVPSAAPPPSADGRRRGRHLGRRRYRHRPLAHPGITEMIPVPVPSVNPISRSMLSLLARVIIPFPFASLRS